jgi:CBS-domain-containing membrane protein
MDAQKTTEMFQTKLKEIKAIDIMSRYAITTSEDSSIEEVAHLMMRFKISGVPILSQKKEMCGIITATDLFNVMGRIISEMEEGREVFDYYKFPVKEFMKTNVITITPQTSLYDIMKIMWEKNVHTLPVVVMTNTEIMGVIGRRDVINACYGTTGLRRSST